MWSYPFHVLRQKMQVDFLTLACFRDFLDALLGARVQQIVLPDSRSVGLELYAGQRRNLLISVDPQTPRMLLVSEKLRRGVEAHTPLLLLLRKWLRRARLMDVTQPPWERILVLHFDGPLGVCQLVVELVGRYSNVALVGPDGCVLEAVRHVERDMSRFRVTLPAHPYQLPPPPPNRRPPTEATAIALASGLARADQDQLLRHWLIEEYQGIGPLVAREIALRATGDAEAPVHAAAPAAVATVVQDLFSPLKTGWWAPHVALDQSGQVVAFTAFEPRQFEHVAPMPDINQAMVRFFETRHAADAYAGARQSVQRRLDQVAVRLSKRAEKLQNQMVDEDEMSKLCVAGELLLTYQSLVPRRASQVTLPDYAGQPRQITLDARRSAVENAQVYFRRYEKARRAAEQIPPLLEELGADQAYLAQLNADLALAESRPEIDAVGEALIQAGWAPQGRRRRAGQIGSPRRFEIEGFLVLVGRNAQQNEHVTFEHAGPEDLWLHVRGLPGAHVVVKRGRQAVPEAVFQRAAQLAVYYSPARDHTTQVAVDVTERRFVRRLKGKRPGVVTYRNEKTLFVRLAASPQDMRA